MEMSLFHFSNVNLQQDPKLQLRREYKKYFLVFSAIKKYKKKQNTYKILYMMYS